MPGDQSCDLGRGVGGVTPETQAAKIFAFRMAPEGRWLPSRGSCKDPCGYERLIRNTGNLEETAKSSAEH